MKLLVCDARSTFHYTVELMFQTGAIFIFDSHPVVYVHIILNITNNHKKNHNRPRYRFHIVIDLRWNAVTDWKLLRKFCQSISVRMVWLVDKCGV